MVGVSGPRSLATEGWIGSADDDGVILFSPCSSDGCDIDSLCLGSGRFLRSVLIPLMSSEAARSAGSFPPAVFQTRGRTFLDSFRSDGAGNDDGSEGRMTYPVDTVLLDGSTSTLRVEIHAAGTLGTPGGRSALLDGLVGERMASLSIIGVGVTEAGLASPDSSAMVDLTDLLRRAHRRRGPSASKNPLSCPNPNGRICVVDMDNVPNNGATMRRHVLENARKSFGDDGDTDEVGFVRFLETGVAFLDTMVDRITSSRAGSGGSVPSCEPVPRKALVVCDPLGDLPGWMSRTDVREKFGLIVRRRRDELDSDLALKLRVANGTHTAVAHVMALSSLIDTGSLHVPPDDDKEKGGRRKGNRAAASVLMEYLDSLFARQILPAAALDGYDAAEARSAWEDWRRRLTHPGFGLSTFFITQNGATKGGLRLGPTVAGLIRGGRAANVSSAFAMAVLLRFLTPAPGTAKVQTPADGIYRGWLDGSDGWCRGKNAAGGGSADRRNCGDETTSVSYADGLRYDIVGGWYEFRCACDVPIKTAQRTGGGPSSPSVVREVPLPVALGRLLEGLGRQPSSCEGVVRSYFAKDDGGNLASLLHPENGCDDERSGEAFDEFVRVVSTLYARMVAGDDALSLLWEMVDRRGVYCAAGLDTPCRTLADGPAGFNQTAGAPPS